MTIKKIKLFRTAAWIAWTESIVLLLIISFAFYTTLPIQSAQTLFVPQGSIDHIISQLTKKGYALTPIDKYILAVLGKPQSGWIYVGSTRLNRIDFLYKLTSAKARIEKITLIPGETSAIFFHDLAEKLHLKKEALFKYYHEFSSYPEAGIYADTYHIPLGIKEKQLMEFLVRESEKKYQMFSEKIYGDYDKKQWKQILTVASIIQKEAANNEEMPLVSSVIRNRIKKGMPLQMDGTLNYGEFSHMKVTPERIRNDETSFNTYKHKGLPDSPIGAVSIEAIKAAIKPAQTDYLYFMKNAQGTHDFTETFTEHRKNIENTKR